MIIASVGMYFGFIDPAYKDVQALQDQKQSFDAAVNNANQLTEKRNELVAKMNSFSADDMLRLSKLVPDYVDNVRLIMEVDRIALKYGMSLREVQVLGVSSAQIKASSGAIGVVSKDYDNVILSFSVSSTYPVFKKFLNELENNLRITDVDRVMFSISQNARADDVYSFSMSLRTYWLK